MINSLPICNYYQYSQYVPFVSTPCGLIELMVKICDCFSIYLLSQNNHQEDGMAQTIVQNAREKSFIRILAQFFPVVGNIGLIFFDIMKYTTNSSLHTSRNQLLESPSPSNKATKNLTVEASNPFNPQHSNVSLLPVTWKDKQYIPYHKYRLDLEESELCNPNSDLFKTKSHEKAKKVFKGEMNHLGLTVDYINADCPWISHDALSSDSNILEDKNKKLDPKLFKLQSTEGVQYDVEEVTKREEEVHLFLSASQTNGGESPSRTTPGLGKAIQASTNDFTHGPALARTNPIIFELINSSLANLNYNMVCKALPLAAQINDEDKKRFDADGYLIANNSNIGPFAEQFKTNYKKFETLCYESFPTCEFKHGAEQNAPIAKNQSIFVLLGAALAISSCNSLDKTSHDCKKLQYWIYVANFIAFFNQTISLAKRYKNKVIEVHVSPLGLGSFDNDVYMFAKAFKQVGLDFQNFLKEEDGDLQQRIVVSLDAYKGDGPLANKKTWKKWWEIESYPTVSGLIELV